VFEAIFSARLGTVLAASLPAAVSGRLDPSSLARAPEAIARLDPPIRQAVVEGIAQAVHTVFLVAVPLAALGFLIALTLREIPLRDTAYVGAEAPARASASIE
jgi:hypothetical protein